MTSIIHWTTLGISDIINIVICIIYLITAFLMFKTFKETKKQTGISLDISQYNIFHTELLDFIEEAKNSKFHSNLLEDILKPLKNDYEKSNGIYYMHVFSNVHTTINFNNGADNLAFINDYRSNVLFPLTRYYDKLLFFVNRIKDDKLLSIEYKLVLYYLIEMNVLPIYFRVSNCLGPSGSIQCNLTPFSTENYDSKTFYEINEFYIANNLFQYKDLKYYKHTL